MGMEEEVVEGWVDASVAFILGQGSKCVEGYTQAVDELPIAVRTQKYVQCMRRDSYT